MATTLSNITSSSNIRWTETDLREGETRTVDPSVSTSRTYTSGTGANQVNRIKKDIAIALESAATVDLDLFDFAGFADANDILGNALGTMAELVELKIDVDASSTGTLLVGNNGTGAAFNSIFNGDDDAAIPLPPGAGMHLYCSAATAWAIADSTNHLLRLTASGGAVTGNVVVMGRSA